MGFKWCSEYKAIFSLYNNNDLVVFMEKRCVLGIIWLYIVKMDFRM